MVNFFHYACNSLNSLGAKWLSLLLYRVNLDPPAVPFEVNRKTLRPWVDTVEQEAQPTRQTASETITDPGL